MEKNRGTKNDRNVGSVMGLCGLKSWAVTGTGAGWQIATLEKPIPVAWI